MIEKQIHNLLKCQICGKSFPVLITHINRTHKLTKADYLKQFPDSEFTTLEYRKKQSLSAKSRFIQNPKLRKIVASRTFDFIKNTDLKYLLSRDYKTAKNCLANGLWKPSIILYGSLIEAILRERTETDYFDKALDVALNKKMISETEFHQIHVVKNSRNFVHLHKELEDKVKVINDYWAKTLSDICESLIKRFRNEENL
jgi:hypothetical protein